MSAPTPEYSPDRLRELLVAGAAFEDRTNLKAAVHLLTFTELPDRRRFAELVEVDQLDEFDDGEPILAAWVRDWAALPASPAAERLSGGSTRLLALAVSLATGAPVDLREHLPVDGHAHARRVIEAVAIATGYGQMYAVTATPKLDQMLADRDALLAG